MKTGRHTWVLLTASLLLLFAAGADASNNPVWEAFEHMEFCHKHLADKTCQPITGAALLALCDSADEQARASCAGHLDGITDYARRTIREWACVPHDALRHPEQIRIMFIKEAYRIPEILHLPASQLVYYVVAKAFPCINPLKIQPE